MLRILQQQHALLASKPSVSINNLAFLSSTNSPQSQQKSDQPQTTGTSANQLEHGKTEHHQLTNEKVYPKVVKRETTWRPWNNHYQGITESDKIPDNQVASAHGSEYATGEYKLYLLAFEKGILDPYHTWPIESSGKGLEKDDPIIIKGFNASRAVACLCEPAQTCLRYQMLYKNELTRCNCGYYMKLVDGDRFWEKLDKRDLLTIPYFRFLEEDGKLDLFLANKLHDEHDHGNIDEEDEEPADPENFF